MLEQRAPGLKRLFISWFGGEPLLALNIMEEICRFVQEISTRTPNLSYASGVTTNGYRLHLATAGRLQAIGVVHYQISLDGPEAVHDLTRVKINGTGSFGKIWNNLLEIRSSSLPIRVLLRVHLTKVNLPAMAGFVRDIKNTFLSDTRFTILLKPIGRWGGPNDEKVPVLEKHEAEAAVKDLTGIVSEARNTEPITSSVFSPSSVCYAARPNSLIIRANGDVAKCTVALSDPANNIGRLTTDGKLQLRGDLLNPWLRGWQEGSLSALECPLVRLPRGNANRLYQRIGVRPPPVQA